MEEERDRLRQIERDSVYVVAMVRRAHEARSQGAMFYLEFQNGGSSPAKDCSIRIDVFGMDNEDNYQYEHKLPKLRRDSLLASFDLDILVIGARSAHIIRLPYIQTKKYETNTNYFFLDVRISWKNLAGDTTEYQHIPSSLVPPEGAISATVIER